MVDLVRSQDNMRGRMFIGIGLVFFQQVNIIPFAYYLDCIIFMLSLFLSTHL